MKLIEYIREDKDGDKVIKLTAKWEVNDNTLIAAIKDSGYVIIDKEKTLTQSEIDFIKNRMTKDLKNKGGL